MSERISVKKRGGRPNRGGGRFNRGGGGGRGRGRGGGKRGRGRGGGGGHGGGGMEGRKGGASAMAAGYDGDSVLYARETYHSEDSYNAPPPRREKAKVPMQKLHMSVENQEMVKDMLQDLHGGGELLEDELDEDTYDELDWRAEDQYWMTDSQLVVQDAKPNFGFVAAKEVRTNYSRMALLKLQRYGFEKARCQDALELYDGDIGKSLEFLLSQCFELKLRVSGKKKKEIDVDGEYDGHDDSEEEQDAENVEEEAKDGMSIDEVLEQRNEEKMALESIYAELFSERIPNYVWSLSLELPHLTELAAVEKAKSSAVKYSSAVERLRARSIQKAAENDTRQVCKFYRSGNCKFGGRCRFKHQTNYQDDSTSAGSTADADEGQSGQNQYTLEVRFPSSNRYPFEPPFVAFYSANDDISSESVLNITSRLVTEAKEQAESACPAVFSLVSVLEDEEEMRRILGEEPLPYSLPEPVISRIQAEYQVRRAREVEAITNTVAPSTDISSMVDKQKAFITHKTDIEPGNGDLVEEDDPDDNKTDELRKKYGRKDISTRSMTPRETERINSGLRDRFKRKQTQESYKKMQVQRQGLPAWSYRDKILQVLNSNQVMVVSGMTGCGKTTQVPQFILDDSLRGRRGGMCNIVCTQPRRISAMAVAERVAAERTERLGAEVGYQIRLESVMSAKTRLLYCTTGILLRRLESDMLLDGVTHVIIDEVHERSEDSDFLMMVLRGLLPQRPDLKVILMSATLNAQLFSEYFNGCPTVEIPGKTFHVDQFFLEDAIECSGYVIEERSPFARPLKRANAVRQGPSRVSMEEMDHDLSLVNTANIEVPKDNIKDTNLTVKQLYARYSEYQKSTVKTLAIMDHDKINNDLIESLIEWIVGGQHEFPRDGAILVFLPGIAEITSVYEQLQSRRDLGGKPKSKFKLIPLHSTLSSEEQQAVFNKPKEGVTKIVLATNIAETSITIDDVIFVIDAGRMKEKRYDSTKGMESLEVTWVSRANALQRRGRAGRVAEGVCFHLFTGHRYEHHLKDQPVPEIQRAPLESLILKIKLLNVFEGLDVKDVIFHLIESPTEESRDSALKRLEDLGALDTSWELTPLGYHLAQLPVDVRIGKLMLFGAIFQCLDPALTIAASLSFKSPFVAPFEKRDEADKKKKEFAVGNSDHLTMLKAYRGWTDAGKHGSYSGYCYCQENFLSIKTLQMLASMKRQFAELLSDIGFISEGLTSRDIERKSRDGGDGVRESTGNLLNMNSENMKLVAAILVAALYPNVVQVLRPESRYQQTSEGAVPMLPKSAELKFKTKPDGYISIHPSSVNFQVGYYESPYLVYHEKVKTTKVYVRDCTMVSVYPLLLFGGGSISVDLDKGNFILSVDDGWIRFMAASHQIAELVRELRLELDQLLQDKIEKPNMDLATCPRGSKIIPTIVKLVSTQ